MLDTLLQFVNTYLVSFVFDLIFAAICLLIGLKLIKVLCRSLEKGKLLSKLDSNVRALVISTLKIVLNTLIIIIAVQILGVPSATIIAALGSCGLAIGLALQGGLSNIAGGVMIMVFKPFHYKDFISTPVGEGTVEEIGLFYTKLVTIDNKVINIPNSVLSSQTVTNLSAKPVRGLDIETSLAYGSDIELARQTLLKCAENCQYILKDPKPTVFVAAHTDSSVKVTLRAYVNAADYWQARFELLETSLTSLKEAGLEIPFLQVDVHMK